VSLSVDAGLGAVNNEPPVELVRVEAALGELVMRTRAGVYELIANGVFLMDSASGGSEQELVRLALEASPRKCVRLLVGGLSIGFSVRAAVESPRVASVTVVEIEQAVIDWQSTFLRGVAGNFATDERVNIHVGRVQEVLGVRGSVATTLIRACSARSGGWVCLPGWLPGRLVPGCATCARSRLRTRRRRSRARSGMS